MDRRTTVIGYVPGTRSLDAEFFRTRFDEPAATLQENEQAVSWFYPNLGVSILIDDVVLENLPTRDFAMPDSVTPNPAAAIGGR